MLRDCSAAPAAGQAAKPCFLVDVGCGDAAQGLGSPHLEGHETILTRRCRILPWSNTCSDMSEHCHLQVHPWDMQAASSWEMLKAEQ